MTKQHPTYEQLQAKRQRAAAALGMDNVVSMEALVNPKTHSLSMDVLNLSLDIALEKSVSEFVKEQKTSFAESLRVMTKSVNTLIAVTERLRNKALDNDALHGLSTKLTLQAPQVAVLNQAPEGPEGAYIHSVRVLQELTAVVMGHYTSVAEAIRVSGLSNTYQYTKVTIPTPFSFLHGAPYSYDEGFLTTMSGMQSKFWCWNDSYPQTLMLGVERPFEETVTVQGNQWEDFLRSLHGESVLQRLNELLDLCNVDQTAMSTQLDSVVAYVSNVQGDQDQRTQYFECVQMQLTALSESLVALGHCVTDVVQLTEQIETEL